MKSPTSSEQAFVSGYNRKLIAAYRAAADRAESMDDDGEPSLEVFRVLQGPMSEVMKDLSIAYLLSDNDVR